MPNRNYTRGRRLEWQVKKDLEKSGYSVIRASGSHGFADLIAVSHGWIRFIQCKISKDKKVLTSLLKKLKNSSPIHSQFYSCGCDDYCMHDSMEVTVELVFKLHGESKYSFHKV
jgi:hypothetical protein